MIKFVEESTKAAWVEITSQILNACFTLQALLVQPERLLLLIWTVRWAKAVTEVRLQQQSLYASKIEKSVPGVHLMGAERTTSDKVNNTEMTSTTPPADSNPTLYSHTSQSLSDYPYTPKWKWFIILALLNGQCVFQYPITIAMWMYAANSTDRVGWVVPAFLPLSFACGAIGGGWGFMLQRAQKQRESGRVSV
jgi:Protein of unknown function (DUF2985)